MTKWEARRHNFVMRLHHINVMKRKFSVFRIVTDIILGSGIHKKTIKTHLSTCSKQVRYTLKILQSIYFTDLMLCSMPIQILNLTINYPTILQMLAHVTQGCYMITTLISCGHPYLIFMQFGLCLS